MTGRLYLGTIAGIRITAHYSWLVILGLFTVSLATGWFPQTLPGLSSAAHWLIGFIAALALFASVLAHELAHSLVARARRVPVKDITLYFFGGSSNLETEPRSPGVDFQITIVGPLTSIVIGGLAWLGQGVFASAAPPVAAVLSYLAIMNGLLAAFNLIPGFPLDGGRVLRSILWKATGSLHTATRWSAGVGQGVASLFFLGGLWLVLTSSVFSGLWLLLIGWFLWAAARAARATPLRAQPLQNVTVERAMSPVLLVVPPGMTVQYLVDVYVAPRGLRAVPVMEGDRLIGLVALADILLLPSEQWEQTRVGQVMIPRERLYTVSPQQPLHEALALMRQHYLHQVLVGQGDRLIGIVQRDALASVMDEQQTTGLAAAQAMSADHLRKAS